jgi:hypothetical protein
MKFKKGDKVRRKVGTGDCYSAIEGVAYIIDDDFSIGSKEGNKCSCTGDWELVTNNITNMSIIQKFALAFKKEPEKSFVKAGITNSDDFLTEDGLKIFLAWMLKKHGEEFKTDVVDGLLEEIAKEDK